MRATPHIRGKHSTGMTMLCVLLALLPAAAAGCLSFGRHAALLLLFTTFSAVLFESFCRVILRKEQTVLDCSAAVSGLLLGMTLPPDLPLWMGAAGSFAAIVIFKQLFGGLGRNFANPAATAHILLMMLFMSDMTAYRVPQTDVLTTVTPVSGGFATYWDLFLGNTAGGIGETCVIGLLLGFVFLCIVGVVSPVGTLSYLISFALLTFIGGYDIPAQLLSGELMLAALFMANDYTTTPLTPAGKCIFGIGCGIITFVIRHFGGYPEGALFAIVIMNLLTPRIDRMTRTVPFGAVTVKTAKQKEFADEASQD